MRMMEGEQKDTGSLNYILVNITIMALSLIVEEKLRRLQVVAFEL